MVLAEQFGLTVFICACFVHKTGILVEGGPHPVACGILVPQPGIEPMPPAVGSAMAAASKHPLVAPPVFSRPPQNPVTEVLILGPAGADITVGQCLQSY